jgi:hypothetical protein
LHAQKICLQPGRLVRVRATHVGPAVEVHDRGRVRPIPVRALMVTQDGGLQKLSALAGRLTAST